MNDLNTKLFIFLVTFWISIFILSGLFEVQASKTSIDDLSSTGTSFDALALVKIMAFQYSSEIPIILSMFLNIIALITILVGISLIRGN